MSSPTASCRTSDDRVLTAVVTFYSKLPRCRVRHRTRRLSRPRPLHLDAAPAFSCVRTRKRWGFSVCSTCANMQERARSFKGSGGLWKIHSRRGVFICLHTTHDNVSFNVTSLICSFVLSKILQE